MGIIKWGKMLKYAEKVSLSCFLILFSCLFYGISVIHLSFKSIEINTLLTTYLRVTTQVISIRKEKRRIHLIKINLVST